jgi:uncharacterized protein YdaU (DUF1376 family)
MAKADIWMPLYPGDYLRDTSRLTTEQHGAYLLLIMDYWTNGPPPDDDAILAQITRMSPNAWSNACSTVRAFFKQCDGKLTHTRIDKEIEAAKEKKVAAVAKATLAAGVRWKDHAPSNATSTSQAMLEQCPSPSPSPSQSTTPEKPIGNSLPRCPVDKIVEIYHQVLPELPRVMALTVKRKSSIKQRWDQLKPESTEDGVESFTDYFKLVRGSDFLMGKKPASNGHKVFVATLEWLVNESNFIKVCERNYHERV